METERPQATDALEISNGRVKCQVCFRAIHLVNSLPDKTQKKHQERIRHIHSRMGWIERRFNQGVLTRERADENLAPLKAELQQLENEHVKDSQLKAKISPLLPYRSSDGLFKWACHKCWDRRYK